MVVAVAVIHAHEGIVARWMTELLAGLGFDALFLALADVAGVVGTGGTGDCEPIVRGIVHRKALATLRAAAGKVFGGHLCALTGCQLHTRSPCSHDSTVAIL